MALGVDVDLTQILCVQTYLLVTIAVKGLNFKQKIKMNSLNEGSIFDTIELKLYFRFYFVRKKGVNCISLIASNLLIFLQIWNYNNLPLFVN